MKRIEDMTPIERAEHAKKEAEKADKTATASLVFAVIGLSVAISANLDRIVLLASWLLSCLG